MKLGFNVVSGLHKFGNSRTYLNVHESFKAYSDDWNWHVIYRFCVFCYSFISFVCI